MRVARLQAMRVAPDRDEGLSIRSIVTDRHLSIGAFVRDDLKINNDTCADREHYNDAWHTVKGCTTIKY